MTATLGPFRNPEYYDQEETKQEKTKKGRKDKENYYLESGKSLGFFYGSGTKRLNIFMCPVEIGDLTKLVNGKHPRTGDKLFTRRKQTEKSKEEGKEPPKEGFDLCFSAPKDFTLMSEFDEDNKEFYKKLHDKACMKALDKMMTMLYRKLDNKNTQGFDVEPIILFFDHETARPLDGKRPDPQVHRHCVVLKKCFNSNGDIRSLENHQVFVNQKLLGAMYRAELANGLREIGFECVPLKETFEIEEDEGLKFIKVNSFKIKGITKVQREMFSNRSLEINSVAGPGATSIDKRNTAQDIRRSKVVWDDKELRAEWNKDANSVGLTKDYIRRLKTFNNDSMIDNSKIEEEIIRTSLARGRLYKGKLMLRLAEYEQFTGINPNDYYHKLLSSGVIVEKGGFKLEYKIKLDFAKDNQKVWQKKIKSEFKECKTKFNSHKLSISSSRDYHYIIKFEPISDDVKTFINCSAITTKNILNELIPVEKKSDSKVISVTPILSSSLSTIESLGNRIGILQAKLFDFTISEEEKAIMQEEIKRIRFEIEELKKKDLNATDNGKIAPN